jgi:hypothetical protein
LYTQDERNEHFDETLTMFPLENVRRKPVEPLVDNRHKGKAALAVWLAKFFFQLFDLGVLFGNATDVFYEIKYPQDRKYINFLYQ